MKHTITGVKPALLIAALAALLPLWATAQQVTVNKVYDFSGNTDTVNSQINYVYADSNRIIALGEAYPDSAKPYAFTAAFDYSGNLLWQKPISLPGDLYPMDSGFNNLVKVKPGLYVAGGNIANAPKEGTYISKEPFLYFFNAQGDSIRLLRFPDSMMDQRLTALAVNDQGNIIAGSSKVPLDSPHTHDLWGSFWFTELGNTGNPVRQQKLPILANDNGQAYYPFHNAGMTNIIPVSWDSVQYIVTINSYDPYINGTVLWLDSTFHPVARTLQFIAAPPDVPQNGPIYIQMTHFSDFEFNFIARKNHPYSFFWSFPVMIQYLYPPAYLEYVDTHNGLYFCRAQITPYKTYNTYNLNWYKALLNDTALMLSHATFGWKVQDRSELAEAVNGDLLVQREVYRPSDTMTYYPNNGTYYFPVLLRVGDTGHLKWGMSFQYIHTLDTGIYHSFYDVSVAPDGRIVMGGFLRSRYAVPGYDTVGKVSWLVVLSDTLHDQQPQPTEPDGIALATAGQQVKLLVYPNPTLDNTTIDVQDFKGRSRDFEWQLSDITGSLLQSGLMAANRETIRLERYSPGVYLLRLNYKGQPAAVVKVLKE